MDSLEVDLVQSERLFPKTKPAEQAVSLSLLDATTSNFASTGAVWLWEKPDEAIGNGFNLPNHLRQCLAITLDAYPQWTGLLKSISTLNDAELANETRDFEPHARRFGRVYAHFGTSNDPGVEFIVAKSHATLENVSPSSRTIDQPLLDGLKAPLNKLAPSTSLANAQRPNNPDKTGLSSPILAVQLTEFACGGGFALAGKIPHPLADITSLVSFMKDWATISRWILSGSETPAPCLGPIFDPGRLDSKAAGDINEKLPDPAILEQVAGLPLHRHDWWISTENCPWSHEVPEPFKNQKNPPIGKSMPWSEWDLSAPVSHYLIHLSRDQGDYIWENATRCAINNPDASRISRHDAVLAHIWSCITRARNQQDDSAPVYCDMSFGTRSILGIGDSFIGSPMLIANVEMTGSELASLTIPEEKRQHEIAKCIRKTIKKMGQPAAVAAHMYSIAYEKAPQRIWQAFMGQRHLLVTSWARSGVYEVDFGLGASPIRYVDSLMPNMDGLVVIQEAPPVSTAQRSERPTWTEYGVDVSIHIRTEDMQRLIRDPLLLPRV